MSDEFVSQRRTIGGRRFAYRTRFVVMPDAPNGAGDLSVRVAELIAASTGDGAVKSCEVDGAHVVCAAANSRTQGDPWRLVAAYRSCPSGLEVEVASCATAAPGALSVSVEGARSAGAALVARLLSELSPHVSWPDEPAGSPFSPAVEARTVTLDTVQELIDALDAPFRGSPLLVVSSLADGTWPVAPADMARALAGMASVWTLDWSDAALVRALNLMPSARKALPAVGKACLYAPLAIGARKSTWNAYSASQGLSALDAACDAACAQMAEAERLLFGEGLAAKLLVDDSFWGGEAL